MGNVLAALKVSALLMFIALGFSIGSGLERESLSRRRARWCASAWLLALIPVMFTYSGWNAAGYIAEEIRDPGRNVPRAFALGTAAVIVIYLLAEPAVSLRVARRRARESEGQRARRHRRSAARRARRRHHGRRLDHQPRGEHQRDDIRRAARVLRDGARRRVLRRRGEGASDDSRHRASAIVAQAVWASLLVLSGSADALTNYTGLRSCCSPASRCCRCSCCARASRTRRGPSRRSAIPSRPRSSSLACFCIVVNGVLQPARSDGRRTARDGCRHPAVHVADTPTKPAGLKPGTTY